MIGGDQEGCRHSEKKKKKMNKVKETTQNIMNEADG